MYLSYNIHRASGWVLLVVATTTCCLFTVNAQLEPQYIPASTADSVTCYPADSLAWRSVPGKMVVHGAPFVKKPTAPVPPAPPMREPGRPLPVDVGVGPAGGFETAPRPPMRLPQQQQQQPFMRPPAGNTRPGPNMNPVVSQQRAIPAVRFLQEGQEHQKVAGAVVDGVGIETPDWMGQGDELTEEDKAAIARESMYANIQIKGLNWFGLDRINIFEGTNYKTIDEVIAFLIDHKINAIRLPFSLEFALTPMDVQEAKAGGGFGELQYPDRGKISPAYYGMTSWEIIDILFKTAGENGILILLDMHMLDPAKGVSRLWYDPEKYSEATVMWGWERILKRYVGHWNLFGLDVMNECHDHASWGTGNPMTDFNSYVERFMLFINERVPEYRGLFFVEGVFLNGDGRDPGPYPYWWGGNLMGADKHPIDTKIAALNDRVVYAPHIYGPDVSNMLYFNDFRFPNNLRNVWDLQFGWLIKSTRKALVVGEWGGSCKNKDGVVQEHLAEWMVENCFQSNFWWALNPGSSDTDGLMSPDWSHFDPFKMNLLGKVQPDPSTFTFDKASNQVCIRHGAPPNPQCASNIDAVASRQPSQVGYDNPLTNAWSAVNRLRGST
ncbi:cellulase 2 [Nannochloropsis oceanica]